MRTHTHPAAEDFTLGRLFHALSDPVRLRLLSLIAEAGEVCACDLLEPIGNIPPAEAEARYYAQASEHAMAA